MRRRLVRVTLLLAVLASVAAPAATPATAQEATRPDPATDAVGWENGYWYDDPISVDQSDGLSDAELEAYVARAMARVEYLRDAEFERSVPVEVIDRDEYRRRAGNGSSDGAYGAWNNQVWEALFVSGEETDSQEELTSTYTGAVAGFYSSRDDEIKIITGTPESPTIDNTTLVHELVHALQDQRYDLSKPVYGGETQDAQLATDGIVEGEANYVEALYVDRCESDEWSCVRTPRASGGSGGGSPPNLAILLTVLQPYSDGPVYVDRLRERGGWAAVDAAMRDPPVSTEQTIHVTDEEPTPLSVEDRARNGWRTFPNQGVDGADTVGEASMFVMFWYQARTQDAATVDPSTIGRTANRFDQYNYDAPPSDGWGNDKLVPYRRQTALNGTQYGYVWVTEWDTEQDADEFRSSYLAILRAHDARTTDDGVRVIEDGPFADAFLVSQNGTRVTVANGPDPAAVRDIRPGAEAVPGGGLSDITGPGFGVGTAVAALVAALALHRRRRR